MWRAWNTFAPTCNGKFAASFERSLKWVLCADNFIWSLQFYNASLPNEAPLLSYVEMIASEKIFLCACHVSIDQPRLVKQLSQSNFRLCCIHFKLPYWCHLGSSLVGKKSRHSWIKAVHLLDQTLCTLCIVFSISPPLLSVLTQIKLILRLLSKHFKLIISNAGLWIQPKDKKHWPPGLADV